jgi:hypothetical protein
MTIALHEEGSKDFTADVGDTWDPIQTTNPNTTDGVFQFEVNLTNMVAGDVLEIRVQSKDLAAGTLRTFDQAAFAHAQSVLKWVSQPIALVNDWSFQMRQRAGSAGRVFPWAIVKVT